jgi:hypothetical protein
MRTCVGDCQAARSARLLAAARARWSSGQSEIRGNSPAMGLCLTELANAIGSDRIRQHVVDRYILGLFRGIYYVLAP